MVSAGTFNTVVRQTELVAITESGNRWICDVACSSGMTKTLWNSASGDNWQKS